MEKLFVYTKLNKKKHNTNCLIEIFRDLKCIIKKRKDKLIHKNNLYYYNKAVALF
jgi:hypothetical protein